MAQSLHCSYAHIIFSTKDREPLISGAFEPELFAYLGGIIKSLNAEPIKINGVADHVHVLIRASKTVSDSDFLKEVKGSSSRWANSENKIPCHFSWQGGYGWFSVSPKHIENAREYISLQKEHHRTIGFQEEYRGFLDRYGVDYDERYLWA